MIYFATGLPVGTGIFILNIPIMIACYKFMGRRYTLLSIVGTIMLSVLADATSFLSTWQIMDDPMLSSITGGILSGIGFGIIYKYNGNSGGLDVIGAIVKKYYSLEMGTVTMILNLVILSAAAYMFSLERAVLTFVAIYIAAFITNKVSSASSSERASSSFPTARRPSPRFLCAISATAPLISTAKGLTPCRINESFMPSSN